MACETTLNSYQDQLIAYETKVKTLNEEKAEVNSAM